MKRPAAAPTLASSAEASAEHVVVEDDGSRAATLQELQSHGLTRARFCCWCEVPRADIYQHNFKLHSGEKNFRVLTVAEMQNMLAKRPPAQEQWVFPCGKHKKKTAESVLRPDNTFEYFDKLI